MVKLTQDNFNILIETFNHKISNVENNLTKLTVDVSWLKKLVSWQIGLLGAITIAVVTTFIKLVVI